MFDRTKYLDIAPYDEQGCAEACKRLKACPEIIYAISQAVYPEATEENFALRRKFVADVMGRLDAVKSYDDFQKNITSGVFLPAVLERSCSGFTFSGAEKLEPNKSYLYISNHRDIVLDCALTDLALYRSGVQLCEMAIGDNLLANQLVEDIFKLNGAIVVKRNLPVREKYLETVRLSGYFVERLRSGKSIWVAQKSGRSKDGLDQTQPAVVKMLHLSCKKEISFPDLVRQCSIVPVSVSYEYDPNDIQKAREEVMTLANGSYAKGKNEDVFSMIRGLRGRKGQVHIAFGDVLDGEYPNAEAAAAEIDRQIHLNYKLFPVSWFCYDMLSGSDANKDKYQDFDSEAFLASYAHLNSDVRGFILNSYANPVRSRLAAEKG